MRSGEGREGDGLKGDESRVSFLLTSILNLEFFASFENGEEGGVERMERLEGVGRVEGVETGVERVEGAEGDLTTIKGSEPEGVRFKICLTPETEGCRLIC